MSPSYKKPFVAVLLVLTLAASGASALAAPPPRPAVAAATAGDGVININEATPAQLAYLPGIGPAKAERIVAYRDKRRFKAPLELARVRGIGLKTVHKLKGWLRVDGPTTLSGPVRLPKTPKSGEDAG